MHTQQNEMLFTTGAVPLNTDVYYGGGEGPILLDELCCNGTESNLLECVHAGIGIHSCSASNVAAVQCLGMYKNMPGHPVTVLH